MSQKPTPKSPRSKSPSCQEDEEAPAHRPSSRRVIEEVRRQVQEELETSERLLHAASSIISDSRRHSRPITVQEGTRSQATSPRRKSGSRSPTCYDDPLQLPSPPRSPMAHASHGATPGTSQGGTRIPTPEYSKSRAGSVYQVRSKPEESGMGPNVPEYEDAMDQRPMYRDMATSFSYKEFNYWNPDEEQNQGYVNLNQRDMVSESTSMRGQPSVPNSRETFSLGPTAPNSNCTVAPSAVTFGTQRAESAVSGMGYGMSRAESAASGMGYGMQKGESAAPSGTTCAMSRAESAAASRTSCGTARGAESGGASRVSCGMARGESAAASRMSCGMARGESAAASRMTCGTARAESAGASRMSCGMARGESAAASRMTCGTARGELSAASGMVGPASNAASRYNYKPEGSSTKVSCKAACMRFADEGERPESIARVDPSKASLPYKAAMSGSRIGQPSWSQQFSKQGGMDHQSHHSGHGMALGRPQTNQYLRPPQAPTPGPSGHQHHHLDEGTDSFLKRDDRATSALAHLSQLKKTPSYYMCGTNQGLDFLSSYTGNAGPARVRFPEPPCLHQDELNELIKCEKQDVESAWYLASEESRTYKKPCPKQQKAQMGVRALVSAHSNQTCGEKYGPMDHPDPDDITPEVAAKMMFTQEQGIKMEECPKDTISHLFPDEPKTPFPEKILRSTISIVDPNQKDREEMMEKSASVPSEGVSDSAYTRTMKEKGDDMPASKSYDVDFAIGQSKREYVLVAQKPQRFNRVQYRGNIPPWFPGYFSAFPGEDGSLKSLPSPSAVFHKAWVNTNPRNIPTGDVFVLE